MQELPNDLSNLIIDNIRINVLSKLLNYNSKIKYFLEEYHDVPKINYITGRILRYYNSIDQQEKKKFNSYCLFNYIFEHNLIEEIKLIAHFNYASFELCCENGYLSTAQLLLTLRCAPSFYENEFGKINIHSNNDAAFRSSCINGYLNVAQWLLTLDGRINIHTYGDQAFRLSCIYGYLNVAQWLLTLDDDSTSLEVESPESISSQNANLSIFGKIDIHMFDDYIFIQSYRNNHLNIIQWFESLEPKYNWNKLKA